MSDEEDVRAEGEDVEADVGEGGAAAEWGSRAAAAPAAASVFIETGRGQTAEVPVGAPFAETIEKVADEAHYGGYFRVFLNGEELVDPEESPATIDAGMRIALTSYDKVG